MAVEDTVEPQGKGGVSTAGVASRLDLHRQQGKGWAFMHGIGVAAIPLILRAFLVHLPCWATGPGQRVRRLNQRGVGSNKSPRLICLAAGPDNLSDRIDKRG
jgi:hypothetical protein